MPVTPAYVQGKSNVSSGASTVAVTMDSDVTEGNIIIVAVGVQNPAAVVSVSDSDGNTYTLINTQDLYSFKYYYCQANSTGALTITATLSSPTGATKAIVAQEFEGLTTYIDVGDADGTGTAPSTSSISSGANSKAFAVGLIEFASSVSSITEGSGYSNLDYSTLGDVSYPIAVAMESKLVDKNTSFNASFSLGSSSFWFAGVVGFNTNQLYASQDLSGDSSISATPTLYHYPSASIAGNATMQAEAIFVQGEQTIERKTYLYKVYDNDGNYLGFWKNVLTDLQFSHEINTLGSAINVVIGVDIENQTPVEDTLITQAEDTIVTQDDNALTGFSQSYNDVGPGTLVDTNYNVDIYVFYGNQATRITEDGDTRITEDGDTMIALDGSPNGQRKFSGYISEFNANYGMQNTVMVTLLSHGAQLDNEIFEKSNITSIAYYSRDPSNILKDALDNFGYTYIDYQTATILNAGTQVTYIFNTNTYKEVLDKVLDLTPTDWFYYIDLGTNLVHLKPRPTIKSHTFILGKHIEEFSLVKTLEEFTNMVYFTGGDIGGGENLFRKYQDTDSIKKYRKIATRYNDGRVTQESSANTISNSIINRGKEPRYRSQINILDETYQIESIELGDLIGFANFNNFIDSITMQVTAISYTPDKVMLQLDLLLPSVSKRLEDINRNLIAREVLDNPDSPS